MMWFNLTQIFYNHEKHQNNLFYWVPTPTTLNVLRLQEPSFLLGSQANYNRLLY